MTILYYNPAIGKGQIYNMLLQLLIDMLYALYNLPITAPTFSTNYGPWTSIGFGPYSCSSHYTSLEQCSEYNNYIGVIIKSDDWATLVQWCDSGITEDVANYFSAGLEIKVIS